ncbi:uncharacterized protein VTP21DRAFT_1553 [Calcarisporiella thermophila]|uniref:uncharacterized protein n=1 Tax=Calcarisporiella thermophila TaxID=911321 RepID=UPI003742D981
MARTASGGKLVESDSDDGTQLWFSLKDIVEEAEKAASMVDTFRSGRQTVAPSAIQKAWNYLRCRPKATKAKKKGDSQHGETTNPLTTGKAEEKQTISWPCSQNESFECRLQVHINLRDITDLQNLLREYLLNEPIAGRPHFKASKMHRQKTCLSFDCTRYIKYTQPFTKLTKDSFQDSDLSALSRHSFTEYLLDTYLSPRCFRYHCPVNRVEIKNSFLRGEINKGFLYSAIAWSAQHLYQYHPKAHGQEPRLMALAKSYFKEAKRSIQDVFDEPSETTVLTSYNIYCYLLAINNLQEAHAYLNIAVSMARQLRIDWDIASEMDPLRREARRRLWWALFSHEQCSLLYGGRSFTLYIPENLHLYKPTPLPHEGDDTRNTLVCIRNKSCFHIELADANIDAFFVLQQFVTSLTNWHALLLNLPQVDFREPDDYVLKTFAAATSIIGRFLPPSNDKRYTRQTKRLSSTECFFESLYWSAWARVWYNFLEPDGSRLPSPYRMETPLMRMLRSMAIEECARAANQISTLLQEIVPLQDDCSPIPYGSNFLACQIHQYIVAHHSDSQMGRVAFQHLYTTYRLVSSKGDLFSRFSTKGYLKMVLDILGEIGAKSPYARIHFADFDFPSFFRSII